MSNPRPRNTTRQREAGAASRAETRRRLLLAATEEFTANGYAAATVARIAERAGVTVQTLYLAWGSKSALLRAYMESALSGDSAGSHAEYLTGLIETEFSGVDDDAAAVLDRLAHVFCMIAGRAAVGWKLYRDAAATDPEIAEDWQNLQRLRRATFTALLRPVSIAALHPGLSPEQAAETAWAIASPETHDLMVRTADHTLGSYQQWLSATLKAALLRTPR